MDDLTGKIAVITGAASGIGQGTAQALAAVGARVVVADIDARSAEAVAAAIRKAGGVAIAAICDVGEDGAFEALRETILTELHGEADIVMNNAGVILSGHPEDIPLSEWQRIFNVNLFSIVRSNAVFLPPMLARGSGHIVNTSSFSGIMTYSFDRLPYAASKAAIFQMSEGLALYLIPKGIGVTVLCPGPVETNIMKSSKLWTSGVEIRGPGAEFAMMSPNEVGGQVVEAIRRNIFFLPTDALVRDRLVRRASNINRYLRDEIDHPQIISLDAAIAAKSAQQESQP